MAAVINSSADTLRQTGKGTTHHLLQETHLYLPGKNLFLTKWDLQTYRTEDTWRYLHILFTVLFTGMIYYHIDWPVIYRMLLVIAGLQGSVNYHRESVQLV